MAWFTEKDDDVLAAKVGSAVTSISSLRDVVAKLEKRVEAMELAWKRHAVFAFNKAQEGENEADHPIKQPEPEKADRLMSIQQFCARYGFSTGFYYRLRREGVAPKSFRLGKRKVISEVEAERWAREMADRAFD